jgi:hypothetical protein
MPSRQEHRQSECYDPLPASTFTDQRIKVQANPGCRSVLLGKFSRILGGGQHTTASTGNSTLDHKMQALHVPMPHETIRLGRRGGTIQQDRRTGEGDKSGRPGCTLRTSRLRTFRDRSRSSIPNSKRFAERTKRARKQSQRATAGGACSTHGVVLLCPRSNWSKNASGAWQQSE